MALGAFLMGLACLGHVAVESEHPDVYEVIAGLLLIGGAAAIFRLARAGRVQQAALCGGAVVTVAMLSVSAFFIAPAPMEPAAELAREKLAGLPAGAQIATVGLSKQVRAAVLLACGLKPAALTESKKPEEQTRAFRKFLQEPGEKFVLMDSRDYAALAEDVREPVRRRRREIGGGGTGPRQMASRTAALAAVADPRHAADDLSPPRRSSTPRSGLMGSGRLLISGPPFW